MKLSGKWTCNFWQERIWWVSLKAYAVTRYFKQCVSNAKYDLIMSWLLCYTYLRYFLMLIQIRLNQTPQMVSGAALEACPISGRLLIAFNIIKCFFENVAHVSHWPKFMKFDFNRWWCVFSHVLFWCVSNSFYIKFHWCRSIEMGLLSFWGYFDGNCVWSNFDI